MQQASSDRLPTQIHFIAVEVGIVWAANTLVQTERPPGSDLRSVTHDRELHDER